VSAGPSAGVERPSSQPAGAWQRMHSDPDSATSWFAIVIAAWNTGSRIAFAIMLPDQRS
jgi:hypothetical protein